ncbi:hypothetical protein RND81_12G149700 [Saponaria officinalis]|uniref:F-box associated beta-propeller type 1 domain-containing protein n=1 Tax=Saponaria officinalis TaxID=3572 RepID=A0AAW1HAX7_SAPOF
MESIHQSEQKSKNIILNIPEEILHYDILTRLPAKSLLRFKSCRDYKIVIVTCYQSYNDPRLHGGVVQFYSTRTNSWKKTNEFSHPLQKGDGVTINNKLHWIFLKDREKDDSNKHDILTFDLHTEKLGGISYSSKLKNKLGLVSLMVSNGRLCTVMRNVTTSGVGIWIMNKYGLSESWMKLYEFEIGEVCFMSYTKVIYGSRMNFEEVLVTKRVNKENVELVWYNLKDKSIRRLGIPRNGKYEIDEWTCIGSLAPIPRSC